MKKNLFYYLIIMLVTVIVSVALLLISAFLPQRRIVANSVKSIEIIVSEGISDYPRVIDWTEASAIDAFTESLIIEESMVMNEKDLKAVFLNPVYLNEAFSPDKNLVALLYDSMHSIAENSEQEYEGFYYVRYWQGFRVFMRVLLTFFNLYEIRRYLSFALFLSMALAVGSISRHQDYRLALAFLGSFILVKPQIICQCVDFSLCFILAFISMLFVPYVSRKERNVSAFFLIVGMVTQYLDYYTVPLVTFGYPMVYLVSMYYKQNLENRKIVKSIAKNAGIWMFGYVSMWIIRLMLVSVFTDVNGFADGFASFASRTGIVKDQSLLTYYSITLAFKKLFGVITGDTIGKGLYSFALVIFLLLMLVHWVKNRKQPLNVVFHEWPLLLIAVLPIVWFAATPQPIVIHYWFQYRMIAVLYFAVLSFGLRVCIKEENRPGE